MKWNKGGDTIWAIIIIAVLILAWVSQGAKSTDPSKKKTTQKSAFSSKSTTKQTTTASNSSSKTVVTNQNKSQYFGQITISKGNAQNEYQPYKEYIILKVSSKLKNPINISGWYLTNAKGDRTYQVGNQITHFNSDIVTIPLGTVLYFPTIQNALFPILLKANSRVFLTTGSGNYNGARMPSFEENKCMGYLTRDKNNAKTMNLYPQLSSSSCPNPKKEPGVSSLEQSCFDFVQSLRSCHTPDFNSTVVVKGVKETGYVDGVANLTPSCKNYLTAHYSYASCVANHKNDTDFYKNNTWRIFLNRNWDIWAKSRETITLFDSSGKVVATYSY